MWFDGTGAAGGWVSFEEAARDCLSDAEKAHLAELEAEWPAAERRRLSDNLRRHLREARASGATVYRDDAELKAILSESSPPMVTSYVPRERWEHADARISAIKTRARARLVTELRGGAAESTGVSGAGKREAIAALEWVDTNGDGTAPKFGRWHSILVKRRAAGTYLANGPDADAVVAPDWEPLRVAAARLLSPEDRAELTALRTQWPDNVRAVHLAAKNAEMAEALRLVARKPEKVGVIVNGRTHGNDRAPLVFTFNDDECAVVEQRIQHLRQKAALLLLPLLQNGAYLASGAPSPGAVMMLIPAEEWAFGLNATWDAPGRRGAQWVDVVVRRVPAGVAAASPLVPEAGGVDLPRTPAPAPAAPPHAAAPISGASLIGMDNEARKKALARYPRKERERLCSEELRVMAEASPHVSTVTSDEHKALWKGLLPDRSYAAARKAGLEGFPAWTDGGRRPGK